MVSIAFQCVKGIMLLLGQGQIKLQFSLEQGYYGLHWGKVKSKVKSKFYSGPLTGV